MNLVSIGILRFRTCVTIDQCSQKKEIYIYNLYELKKLN